MIYKSAYIYQSGAIECGDCIYATSDADAVLMGRGRAKLRRAELFGLHEVAGKNDSGGDVLRPIGGKRIFRQTEDELIAASKAAVMYAP